MSEKTSLLEKTNFSLSLRAHKAHISSALRGIAVVILLGLVILKALQMYHTTLVVKLSVFALFLLVLGVAVILGSYLVRLRYTNENTLELNEEGLYDSASFCAVGFIPIVAIEEISFSTRLGLEFLVIRFTDGAKAFRRVPRFSRQIYRLVVGRDLWIPLSFFKISRIDLESQIIHLDRIIQKGGAARSSASPARRPMNATENPLGLIEGVPIDNKPRVVQGRNKSLIQGMDQSSGPPPLSQATPERNRVVKRVEEIKRKVRESGFDLMVAQLYLDQIAVFPNWIEAGREALPAEVRAVRGMSQGTDYEEVSFSYAGRALQFGLRRDIGASDEALLSVGVEGRVHMSLRVRVEIGELEPLELESFIVGPWQEDLLKLKKQIDEAEAKRLGVAAELTDPGQGGSEEQTATSIQDLKNRFGLDE